MLHAVADTSQAPPPSPSSLPSSSESKPSSPTSTTSLTSAKHTYASRGAAAVRRGRLAGLARAGGSAGVGASAMNSATAGGDVDVDDDDDDDRRLGRPSAAVMSPAHGAALGSASGDTRNPLLDSSRPSFS